jgi:acetate kinase
MKILVLNCGSSSLKFQLIETSEEHIPAHTDRALAHGVVERIGSRDAKITYQAAGGPKEELVRPIMEHKDAIQFALEHLKADPRDIEAVGHRIVHGGETFHESVLIDDDVLKQIEVLSELAPLHNPNGLKGYYASRALFPEAKQAAVFDTAFHHTLPPRAFLFGIPYEFYTRYKIRRYGFHGTSHRYVSWRYAWIHKTTRAKLKLITCHLGNGCSVCAIDHGRSIDTSMGFTPMDGLLMGTRPGDIDPGAVLYLVKRDPNGVQGVETLLNQHSGMAGISGGVSDMRELLARRDQGDPRAKDAIDVFCYRAAKYIGAYVTVLGGADAVLFAGGIGENAAPVRRQICQELGYVGIDFDPAKNDAAKGTEAPISHSDSRLPVWVVPTNEELMIARDTYRLVHNLPRD